LHKCMRRFPAGFTFIELLIVIGIILFLLALIGVAAGAARERAAISTTPATRKRGSDALGRYHPEHHDYPSLPVAGDLNPDTCPYSTVVPLAADAAFWKGIDLETRMLEHSGIDFKRDELDQTGKYVIDAWGNRLRYRKLGRESYLVWS